jgi:hypothetical protein
MLPPVRRADGEQKGTYDVRNSWQVVVGSLLIPLGIVLILIAWDGAAHAKVDQGQIPYLISGGLAGLGCMVVGGLFYWGHWLYRIYDQADLHHQEQQQLMRELIAAIGARPADTNGTAATSAPAWPAPSETSNAFYATAAGSVYHRAGCPVIAHHPADLRVIGPGNPEGLRPCQICDPAPTSSES